MMRGEKAQLAMRISRMDILRCSIHLLILLLVWIAPVLVWVEVGLGWEGSPRISIKFLLGRKNVCLVRRWGAMHIGLANWFDKFAGFGVLFHGLVTGVCAVG